MSEQINSDDASLRDIVLIIIKWSNYFLSKWKLVLIVSILGAAVGYAIAYFSKPIYTAELTLALDDKGSGSSPYSGIASQFGIDVGSGGGAFAGENNIELLKSRFIVETTLLSPITINGKRDILINRYIEFNGLREQWAEDPELKDIVFEVGVPREKYSLTQDSILYCVYKQIKNNSLFVDKIEKKLSIISIKVKSQDQLFAKLFTEVVVETASDFYIQTKTKKAKVNLDILSNRLDSVKRELDREIYGAAMTKDKNMNVIRAEGGIQSAKKQLNVQVLTTMYGELIKNTEMAKYTLMREEPLVQIIDRPILPLEKKKSSKSMGLVMGGFSGLFLSLVYLWIMKLKENFLATLSL